MFLLLGRRRHRKAAASSDSDSGSSSDSSRKHRRGHRSKRDKHRRRGLIGTIVGAVSEAATASRSTPQTPFPHEHQTQSGSGSGPTMQQTDRYNRSPVPFGPPPGYSAPPPSSGYRVPLTTTTAFPSQREAGQPPCYDIDGVSPVYMGSAMLEDSVQPCKVAPHFKPSFVSVSHAGGETYFQGRFDMLPFTPDSMEFVRASHGRIPPGRRPIEGGYDEKGSKLYHGVALIDGVRVPGKVGEQLGACHVALQGAEYVVRENYELLYVFTVDFYNGQGLIEPADAGDNL